jgi:hypothetical protein
MKKQTTNHGVLETFNYQYWPARLDAVSVPKISLITATSGFHNHQVGQNYQDWTLMAGLLLVQKLALQHVLVFKSSEDLIYSVQELRLQKYSNYPFTIAF